MQDSKPNQNCQVFGELLYWYASEETSNTWVSVSRRDLNIDQLHFTETANLQVVPFKWDFGFRIGAVYQLPKDDWNLLMQYTWFQTNANANVPRSANLTISSQFFCANANGDVYQGASTHCHLGYNMFDLDLRRKWDVSKELFLHPLIGLRGGWVNHKYQLTGITSDSITATEYVTNDFYGVGPTGGMDSQWICLRTDKGRLFLLGHCSTAFLCGMWTFSDTYRSSIEQQLELDIPSSTVGALMFRSFLGLGWDWNLRKDRFRMAVQVGYEMEFWLSQMRVPTFFDDRLHHDFTLQGGSLNVSLDF